MGEAERRGGRGYWGSEGRVGREVERAKGKLRKEWKGGRWKTGKRGGQRAGWGSGGGERRGFSKPTALSFTCVTFI